MPRSEDALDPLPVHRYRAHLRCRRPLRLADRQLGVVLRGAFGLTLRRLVCHDLDLACRACPLRGGCAYPAVFEPGARDDRPAVGRIADPPRPFVLRPTTEPGGSGPSEALTLDLHVVGKAHEVAPTLLATLQRIADDGLGPERTPLSLERIDALDALGRTRERALDLEAARLSPSAPPLRARDLTRPGDEAARCIRIRFVTPTLLREAGVAVSEPVFGTLIRRLRARLGALATVFGDGPIEDDPREVGDAANAVRSTGSDVQWLASARRSTRTHQTHPLEGFVGEAHYEGELARYLPMLRLAELLHVGKHASFGLGRLEVDVLA